MKMLMVRIPKGELACVPECHHCHKPILDFNKANLCSYKDETSFPIEMDAFHWECDPGFHPWRSLAEVMKMDQRLRAKDGRVITL
jgi:hypothetical protein